MDIELAHQRMLEEWEKMGRRPHGPPAEGLPEDWNLSSVCFTGFDERIEPILEAMCSAWGIQVVADVADRPDLLIALGRRNDLGSRIDRELFRRAEKAGVRIESIIYLAQVEGSFTGVVSGLLFAREMMTWLTVPMSVAEVDARFRTVRPFGDGTPNPLKLQWESLKRSLESGDELWAFSSPSESWSRLCGRAGIAVVRGGKIVAQILTSMS